MRLDGIPLMRRGCGTKVCFISPVAMHITSCLRHLHVPPLPAVVVVIPIPTLITLELLVLRLRHPKVRIRNQRTQASPSPCRSPSIPTTDDPRLLNDGVRGLERLGPRHRAGRARCSGRGRPRADGVVAVRRVGFAPCFFLRLRLCLCLRLSLGLGRCGW